MSEMTPEMQALKSRLKNTWSAGDFGEIARTFENSAVTFLNDIGIDRGTRVLDVACGTGQLAIPAARSGAIATGIDIAPNLIAQARERAKAEGLDVHFDEGDAENMPYPDGSFDLVISLFGAMFAPRPDRAAAELIRVCRPGGRIVMGNWTPGGFVGSMFKTVTRHVPPPPLMPSPLMWGEAPTVRERLADGVGDIEITRRHFELRYPFPPPDVVSFYEEYFGPTRMAFNALDEQGQRSLRADLQSLWAKNNMDSTNGSTVVESEALQVIAYREDVGKKL